MTSELERLANEYALDRNGGAPGKLTERETSAYDYKAGFLQAIEIAEAECQKVEGRTTKYYRGDTTTANELLEVLKRHAGLTKEPTNEEG